MRISDWSSDVCSSDLPRRGVDRDRLEGADNPLLRRYRPLRRCGDEGSRAARARRLCPGGIDLWRSAPRAGRSDKDAWRSCRAMRRERRDGGDPGLRRGTGSIASLSFLARSEEHTSELQSLIRTSYAVFSLK